MAETSERWVEINGTRYREVVYQGRKYYLQFNQRDIDTADIDCALTNKGANPNLVEAGVHVYKRTKAFVSLLTESCESLPSGQSRVTFKLDPRIGIRVVNRYSVRI